MDKPSSLEDHQALLDDSLAALKSNEDDYDRLWAPMSALLDGYRVLLRDYQRLSQTCDKQATQIDDLNDRQSRLLEKFAQLEQSDVLTGLLNFNRFWELTGAEWQRSARSKSPMSLILADLDCFTEFNERYGMSAGDQCLQKVAGLLEAIFKRPTDIVGRYLGTRFLCAMPETDRHGAAIMARRILGGVREMAIPHESSSAADVVTVSVGVVSAVGKRDVDPGLLLKAGEALVRKAKEAGRNQVQEAT